MQVPALNIFETSFRRGKFDASRKLANGGMLEFTHIYPMDAVFDTPEDVPEEVSPEIAPLNHPVEEGQRSVLLQRDSVCVMSSNQQLRVISSSAAGVMQDYAARLEAFQQALEWESHAGTKGKVQVYRLCLVVLRPP